MGVWLGPRGVPKYKKPPAFTYTGNCDIYYDTAGTDGTVNWQIVFLTSGTLRFSRVVPNLDVFLVGHGETGHQGTYSSPFYYGGKGGRGGELKTVRSVPVSAGVDYSIVIPAEGSNTTASFRSDCFARSGNEDSSIGASGGVGAHVADNNPFAAGSGTQGGLSFGGVEGEDRSGYYPNYRYGAGGGGGGAGSPGGTHQNGGAGGTNGGGQGGNYNGDGSAASQNNSGSGGGGGGKNADVNYLGGAGGPGIVIIRNAR